MKVGVGRRTFPSPIGEYLGGFASRTEPCKGVLDDLFVKTALFKDRGNTFLIISLDVVCLNTALSDEIRQMIYYNLSPPPLYP
jgi:neutral ceramidase